MRKKIYYYILCFFILGINIIISGCTANLLGRKVRLKETERQPTSDYIAVIKKFKFYDQNEPNVDDTQFLYKKALRKALKSAIWNTGQFKAVYAKPRGRKFPKKTIYFDIKMSGIEETEILYYNTCLIPKSGKITIKLHARAEYRSKEIFNKRIKISDDYVVIAQGGYRTAPVENTSNIIIYRTLDKFTSILREERIVDRL